MRVLLLKYLVSSNVGRISTLGNGATALGHFLGIWSIVCERLELVLPRLDVSSKNVDSQVSTWFGQ